MNSNLSTSPDYQPPPHRLWIVIPVYNNAATIADVAERCRKILPDVLVIDDGSSDIDVAACLRHLDLKVIRHSENRGKGAAILTALNYLVTKEADYMITIDGDGQHYPEDIPRFFPLLQDNDYSLVIGCRDFSGENIPEGSKKGRRVANFWMKIETGLNIDDCQSGFRAYPVKYFSRLKFICRRYNFETEALVRAAWAGLELKTVTVRTWYPPPDARISHFRPWLDNWRISLIHFHLTGLRLLPLPNKKLVKKDNTPVLELLHPLKFLKYLLHEHATPGGLAAAAALGTFLAIIPIPGFHSAAIIYAASKLHLNKIMAFNIQHLFMPPFTPLLCIEVGYYLLNGQWLLRADWQTLVAELPQRFAEWALGAAVLAPLGAALMAAITWITVKSIIAIQRTTGRERE